MGVPRNYAVVSRFVFITVQKPFRKRAVDARAFIICSPPFKGAMDVRLSTL